MVPSGTLATMTMINPLIKTYNGFYPLATPIIKNTKPITIANLVINLTTWAISNFKLEVSSSVPVTLVAILPINVLFPVLITIPIAYPS